LCIRRLRHLIHHPVLDKNALVLLAPFFLRLASCLQLRCRLFFGSLDGALCLLDPINLSDPHRRRFGQLFGCLFVATCLLPLLLRGGFDWQRLRRILMMAMPSRQAMLGEKGVVKPALEVHDSDAL
jgi:glucose-6-phosphate-specific signal transduction histidine kinase